MLDLDHTHARRTNGDNINLVGLEVMRDREGEVRQEDPLAVAGLGEETLPKVLDGLTLALVGQGAAWDDLDPH